MIHSLGADSILALTIHICQKCGKPIHNYRGHGQKYCDACRSSREHAHSCLKCGKPIPNYRGHGQKYCDACRDVVNKENKKRWAREYRRSIAHSCVNCGKPIYGYTGHGQRYCKICSVNIRLENVRLLRLAYYRKWKVSLGPELGSCWLSQNPRNSFDDEYLAVRRELKRLGLKN